MTQIVPGSTGASLSGSFSGKACLWGMLVNGYFMNKVAKDTVFALSNVIFPWCTWVGDCRRHVLACWCCWTVSLQLTVHLIPWKLDLMMIQRIYSVLPPPQRYSVFPFLIPFSLLSLSFTHTQFDSLLQHSSSKDVSIYYLSLSHTHTHGEKERENNTHPPPIRSYSSSGAVVKKWGKIVSS